jgi:KipI family sensor histidine kinase inhibitor
MIDLIPLGDRAWLARFATESDAGRWAIAARNAALPDVTDVTDVVIAYRSVSIHVKPDEADWSEIEARLRGLTPIDGASGGGRLVTLPVLYEGDDLLDVARRCRLTREEVIAVHSGTAYDVFAIGFKPGFPYAGYLPSPLDEVPRRDQPRLRVPAGSVAIAAGQTGVYPDEFPGGWNLIGRTPLTIVDLEAGHFPIRAGDRLQFMPIDRDEFEARNGEALR